MKRPANAWIVFAVTAACLIGAALLPDEDWPLEAITILGTALLFSSLCGALIGSKRPENNVGWILLAISLSISSGLLATQWANRALVDGPGSLPGGIAAAWFQSWLWTPLTGLFPLLVLLFPTGKLLSRRWRILGWAIVAAILLPALAIAFRPGGFETFPKVQNPLGFGLIPGDLFAWLAGAWIATIPASVVSLFIRFRRGRGAERQQIKWFFFAAVTAIALVLSNPLIYLLNGNEDPSIFGFSIGLLFPVLAFLILPVAIAFAVLRHRLFDIDRIISRTFSYAIVTAVLGGVFALCVLLPTVITYTEEVPDYLIAVATLIIAALFRPLRRRVQVFVDRRFNRARYDAEHTIETFTARLREEIDLDTLGAELKDVVSRTMQPAHASVWMRGRP